MSSRLVARGDLPLYAITLGHALTHWYPSSFFLILPVMANQIGLSYTQVGVLIAIRSIALTLVNLPGGAIVDMVGRRGTLMALSLALCCVPYVFLGLTNSYALIVLCSALMGIGTNLWHPAAISDLSERYPGRRGWVLSIHALGANLGDLLGPLVVGFLLVTISYTDVFVANFVPGLALAGLFFLWVRGETAKGGGHEQLSIGRYWAGVRALARNAPVVLLSIVGGMRAMTQNGLATFIPFYLTGLGMTPALVGIYLAVVQGAGLVASPAAGGLSDRFGRKPFVVGGMVAVSVAVVIFANLTLISLPGIDFTWLFVAAMALIGFFLFALRPVMQAWTMDMVPKEMGGTTVGVMFGSQSLFSAVAPAVGGVLADNYGLIAAFYFIAGTILLANLIVLLVPERLLGSVAMAEPVGAR